mmetsp:Transcript_80670/g.260711  ORF Transcript_80670/g.260711 Transcript_80670/m.260711 type:complete len:322 (+) Transcript_80670:82-1047(+)
MFERRMHCIPPSEAAPDHTQDGVALDAQEQNDRDHSVHLMRAYYTEADMDSASLTFCGLLALLNPSSRCAKKDKNASQYPEYLNANILRVVDLFACLGMFFAFLTGLVSHLLRNHSGAEGGRATENDWQNAQLVSADILTLCGNASVIIVTLKKIYQVVKMPAWQLERRIAFKIFGKWFIPVHSRARRLQLAVFAFESVVCIDLLTHFLFADLAGLPADAIQGVVLGYRLFLASFYLSMFLWRLCPLWSLVGLLVGWGLMRMPTPFIGAVLAEHINPEETYHYHFDHASARLSFVRYGLFGPRNAALDISPVIAFEPEDLN